MPGGVCLTVTSRAFVKVSLIDTTIRVAEEPGGFGLCATGLEYRVVIRGARVP